MKKLLFVGHTYHQKTKSSIFILEMLRSTYDVTEHYMDPAASFKYESFNSLLNKEFDILVVWQIMPVISSIRKIISWKYSVFFPMYDHYIGHHGLYLDIWKEYRDFVIISFSRTLYNELNKSGFDVQYIQYFPNPSNIKDWGEEDALFFWQRLSILNLDTVARALQNFTIKKIHRHKVPDPGHSTLPISSYVQKNPTFYHDITFSESTWFSEKEEMIGTIERASLYMAPRHFEGIGMSFLEAMAHGRCVISPDNPTMNEYITHGINGLLYQWDEYAYNHCKSAVEASSLSIRQIQENAYKTIVEGYEKWNKDKFAILDWLGRDARPNNERMARSSVLYGWEDWPIEQQPWPVSAELQSNLIDKKCSEEKNSHKIIDVSVITVVYNIIKDGRREMFLQCLESVQMQKGVNVEHIIVDGASADGTLDLVKSFVNSSHELRIFSSKDQGIYEAMNRGIALSRGKYVVFLNSDDFYHSSEGLRISVDQLQKTQCSFSFAPVKIIDDTLPCNPHVAPTKYLNEVFLHSVFSHQSVLVLRELMIKMHGFDMSYRSAADYDFILRMIFEGYRGCYVNQSFVSYRMIGVSSTNLSLSGYETALVYKRLFNRFANAHLTTEEAYRIHRDRIFPQDDSTLELRLMKFSANTFVGVPSEENHNPKGYMVEIRYILKQLCRFRFKQLIYFFIIHFSSYFDRTWYLKNNKDVLQSSIPPAAHYLEYGWREGRNPSLKFSTSSYLNKNPDVKNMNICPLVHWRIKGKKEKRSL